MKRPQPDIGDILKASFIKNMGGARKFKRLWGTTTVGGVEVLKNRQYYFPTSYRSANFEKLYRYLGAYEDVVSTNPSGVQSAWLYINKNKGSALPDPEGLGELSLSYHDFVAHNLNQLWWDDDDGPMPEGLTLTTSIVIEGELNTTRDTNVSQSDLLDPNTPTEELAQAIQTNYESLWNTCLISQQGVGVINKGSLQDEFTNVVTQDEDDLSPDDPWLDVIARYALRTNGIPCTIKDVEKGYGRNEAGRIYYTYVVTLEIPYIAFTTSDPIVNDVVTDLNGTYTSKTRTKLSYPNGYYTQYGIKSMDSTDLIDDPDLVTRPYRLWEDEAEEIDPTFSSIWLRSGDTWYLKADVFDNPRSYGLTYKKLYNYVMTLIDSGYQKKKVKWWKKAIAFIIVTVSVYFLGPVAGVIVGSLVLTVASLLFAMAGMDDWATAFMEVNKTIEPLVIIASIYLVVTGVYNAYKAAESAAQEAAKQAGKEVAEAAIEDVIQEMVTDLVEDFVQNIVKGATDLLAGNINATSTQFLSKMVKLLTVPEQLKLDAINDRNKDLRAEYEELVQEMSRENDVLAGFAKIYGKPATADWSMYAAVFDHPYERGGGPLAMGNIQRTTKQALRKADYSDPVFANILVV